MRQNHRAVAVTATLHSHWVQFSYFLLALMTAAVVVSLVLFMASPSQAAGPRYQHLSLEEKYASANEVRKLKKEKDNVVSGRTPLSSGSAVLDEYYDKYLFRAMSRLSNLGRVSGWRREILKDLTSTKSPAVHKYIVDKVLGGIAIRMVLPKNKFNPAVRYNLVLLFGQLNQQEGSNSELPIPQLSFRKDLSVIGGLIKLYENPDQVDAVRVAAMLGLRRHVEIRTQLTGSAKLGPQDAEAVTKLALDLATAQQPPAGRNPSGHDWMRRRAVEILGTLGSAEKDDEIEKALTEILSGVENTIALRCMASNALGQIKLEKSDEKANLLSRAIVQVGASACDSEVARLDEMFDAPSGGMMGEMGGYSMAQSMPGRGMMDDDSYFDGEEEGRQPRRRVVEITDLRTVETRRRLIHQLRCVKRGLTGKYKEQGVVQLASGEMQEIIEGMAKQLDNVLDKLFEPETVLEALTEDLREEAVRLTSVANGAMPDVIASSATPADAEDFTDGVDADALEGDDDFIEF